MSKTHDEENDETEDPVEPDKPYPRKPSHIAAVTVVATRAPVDILTRAPIDKGNPQFQPVTTTVFPSAKLPDSLL